jgi:hypothetical protein
VERSYEFEKRFHDVVVIAALLHYCQHFHNFGGLFGGSTDVLPETNGIEFAMVNVPYWDHCQTVSMGYPENWIARWKLKIFVAFSMTTVVVLAKSSNLFHFDCIAENLKRGL